MRNFVELSAMESITIAGGKSSAVAGLVYRIGVLVGVTVSIIKYCRDTFTGRMRLAAAN